MAKELDELWEDVFDGRFPVDHAIGNAVDLRDIFGDGHLRIDERLKGS
jgi:hypothetical protein